MLIDVGIDAKRRLLAVRQPAERAQRGKCRRTRTWSAASTFNSRSKYGYFACDACGWPRPTLRSHRRDASLAHQPPQPLAIDNHTRMAHIHQQLALPAEWLPRVQPDQIPQCLLVLLPRGTRRIRTHNQPIAVEGLTRPPTVANSASRARVRSWPFAQIDPEQFALFFEELILDGQLSHLAL